MERFDGTTYDPPRDEARLTGSLLLVWSFMRDGRWHTLKEIGAAARCSEAAASARLRDLRKPRFGGHVVHRQYLMRGLHQYRLDVNPGGLVVP